ncbi:MAG TPA: lysylphosphatidylglycerol synthase transmembrane domain-containing protein, partial [Tepidisphaeraceae bacterium]
MKQRARRILKFSARWLIALIGIVWVLSNLHLRDRVLIYDGGTPPYEAELAEPASETSVQFVIIDPTNDEPRSVGSDVVLHPPDRKSITLADPAIGTRALLGMRLIELPDGTPYATALLIENEPLPKWIDPSAAAGGFAVDVPQPRVQEGVNSMLRGADRRLLVASVAVMPVTYFFTTLRWHALLGALGITLTLSRAFVLNMVGAFYNTLMLGSTGGDVLKAYYAARQVPARKTAAVMSVIIDRVIGLLALIILGGSMAALQYATADDRTDAVSRACLRVAIAALLLLGGTLAGLTIAFSPLLRRALGLSLLRSKAPMQDRIDKVIEVLKLYQRRPTLMLWTILMTFPVHLAVVVSALLAGKAFALPIHSLYYFIVV